jgi:hypothetical protein
VEDQLEQLNGTWDDELSGWTFARLYGKSHKIHEKFLTSLAEVQFPPYNTTAELSIPQQDLLPASPDPDAVSCDVCGKIFRPNKKATAEQRLHKHYKIHIRERNKRSGRGNGKRPNKKPWRRRRGKAGEHALLPPRNTKERKKHQRRRKKLRRC